MQPVNPITDIFFDLDHTLWDFERNSALAFEAVFAKHHIALSLSEFLKHYVPLNLKYWERYRNEEISQEQLRYGRLKDAFDLSGHDIDDETILILSEDYIQFLPQHNHLFDGARDVLEYLNKKYRLHIITNGFDQIQRRKINNSNIGHYFHTITNSEMAGVKKPNPLIFEYALAKAETQKERSIMIGDCLDADVRGALNYGLDAILFSEVFCDVKGIKQVKHLNDLKKHL